MDNKPLCKGCSITARVSEQEIELTIDKLSRLKGMKFVEPSVYTDRLEKCSTCQYLEYGNTCLQCGCIVQIKAKLPDSRCPYPGNRQW